MRGSQEIFRQLEKRKVFGIKENPGLGVNWFLDLFFFLCNSEQLRPLLGLSFPIISTRGLNQMILITPCRRKLVRTKLTRKTGQFTPLILSFLIYKMGMIIALGCVEDYLSHPLGSHTAYSHSITARTTLCCFVSFQISPPEGHLPRYGELC